MCVIPESIVIPCCLLTSLLVRGIKIGKKSKLGWLMVFSRRHMRGLLIFPAAAVELCLKDVTSFQHCW